MVGMSVVAVAQSYDLIVKFVLLVRQHVTISSSQGLPNIRASTVTGKRKTVRHDERSVQTAEKSPVFARAGRMKIALEDLVSAFGRMSEVPF